MSLQCTTLITTISGSNSYQVVFQCNEDESDTTDVASLHLYSIFLLDPAKVCALTQNLAVLPYPTPAPCPTLVPSPTPTPTPAPFHGTSPPAPSQDIPTSWDTAPVQSASAQSFKSDQACATIFASPPQEGIAPSTSQQISSVPALKVPTFKILVVSKAFPWPIVICAPVGSVVTCSTIFEELYEQLQRQVRGVEWAIVTVDKTWKEAEKAAKSRQAKDKVNRLKRIDWLGDKTVFEGLERRCDKQIRTRTLRAECLSL